MKVAPGMRLRSAVCTTEVVVVAARQPEVDLCCGGHPMVVVPGEAPAELSIVDTAGTLLGKRYALAAVGLELLCTKSGEGGLSVAGDPVPVKEPKPLPSSD